MRKKNDKAAAEQSETAAPTTESTTAPDPKPVLSGDAALKDGETYTGRAPLPLVDFNVSDPENTRGLSTEKHGYGYGIAKDGKPNDISVNNQNTLRQTDTKRFASTPNQLTRYYTLHLTAATKTATRQKFLTH